MAIAISAQISRNRISAERLPVEGSLGHKKVRLLLANIDDPKGRYAFALTSNKIFLDMPKPSLGDQILRCLGIRRWVVLHIEGGYVKVNQESLRKRLGLSKSEFKAHLKKSLDFTDVVRKKLLKEKPISTSSQAQINQTASLPNLSDDPRKNQVNAYIQRQKDNGETVDLLIGRGRKFNPKYPNLVQERYNLEKNQNTPYRPLIIDINSHHEPDLVADVSSSKSMECFPDASVDDIYLERIHPPQVLITPQTYINAARILKPFGKLVIDYNWLCKTHQEADSKQIIVDALKKYKIPLEPFFTDSRSDLQANKMVFQRTLDKDLPNLTDRDIMVLRQALEKASKK